MEIISIIAILLSPIIALFISNKLQAKNELRKEKISILKILMINRATANSIDYVNALNLIDIVFVDSKKVRESYRLLYESYNPQVYNFTKSQMMLTKLIEAIVKDIGYKEKITWDTIQQPYIPIWLTNEIQTNSAIKECALAIANFALNVNKQPDCNQENNKDGKN